MTHLDRLEAESIHIMREVVAETANPVMLYSIGKDSAVMLHLAKKAFFPAPPPFPLLHVDTTWKFQAMYALRERAAREAGMELIVHRNPEAEARGINPFDHGALHTDMWKTQGLKQALDARRLRRGVRRRAARRGEGAGEGAHLLVPLRQPSLGTALAAARAVASLQCAAGEGRERCASSRCPTGPSWTCGNTSPAKASRSCPLYFAAPRLDGGARRPDPDGRRRPLPPGGGRGAGRAIDPLSARSAATR